MYAEDEVRGPHLWRVVLAFAITPGIGALALSLLSPLGAGLDGHFERMWRSALIFSVFAYPQGLLFGLPIYGFLRNRLTWLNCSLAGLSVAAIPWLIVFLLSGDKTADQYRTIFELAGLIAISGAVAGFVFWVIVATRRTVG